MNRVNRRPGLSEARILGGLGIVFFFWLEGPKSWLVLSSKDKQDFLQGLVSCRLNSLLPEPSVRPGASRRRDDSRTMDSGDQSGESRDGSFS